MKYGENPTMKNNMQIGEIFKNFFINSRSSLNLMKCGKFIINKETNIETNNRRNATLE